MPASRLRLGIAAWFAVAFLAGLVILDLSLYGYLRYQASHRLTRDLGTLGRSLGRAVVLERAEAPDSGLAWAARETLTEWVAPPGAYLVLDSAGTVLAERGDRHWVAAAVEAGPQVPVWDGTLASGRPVRRVVVPGPAGAGFRVAVLGSAELAEAESQNLAVWLAVSLPLVLLLSMAGGYLLSRRALRPIQELEQAIAAISPDALDQRLRVHVPPDEVDGVRAQVNILLARLERARDSNRLFLRQAAHQIRTPLTLVMGEASLALPEAPEGVRAVLARILRASEQMQRRVADLFVMAEARTGSPVPLDEVVDVDGLLLEVADAARARARQLGHALAFGEVEPLEVRGNRALLREALLELVENALIHGAAGSAVELSTRARPPGVTVQSAGPAFRLEPAEDVANPAPRDRGLGLTIVAWIAATHGGRLEVAAHDGVNAVTLQFPVALPDAAARPS